MTPTTRGVLSLITLADIARGLRRDGYAGGMARRRARDAPPCRRTALAVAARLGAPTTRRTKKPRPTYRALEAEPSYEHPVDRTVRMRVGRRKLQRTAADSATAIIKALGRRRRLWCTYEAAADEMRARREAAYSDVGVEHGIGATRANALATRSKNIRAVAERVVHEVLRTGVARREAVGTALVAA